MEIAKRADRGDSVARLEAEDVGRADAGAAILPARRRGDADIEAQLLVRGRVGGERIVAPARRRGCSAHRSKTPLGLPDLGKRLAHRDLAQRDLRIGRDVELQVLAGPVVQLARARLGLEHQFLDEGGHIVVADHAEGVGGGGLRSRPSRRRSRDRGRSSRRVSRTS